MLIKISNSFLYTEKVTFFVLKASNSSNSNPLKPDLFPLYRRPNPSKIWPIYAVPLTTTLYTRSTYVNRLKNWSRSPRSLRAGPTNPRFILDQHTLSSIKARSLPIRPFFQSGRERGWSVLWCERAFKLHSHQTPDQPPLIPDQFLMAWSGMIG